MTRHRILTISVCVTAFLCSSAVSWAQKGDPLPKPEWILKVYRVADLLTPRPDHPYQGGLPTTGALKSQNSSGSIGGGSFGGGGLGGMGGGGFGGGSGEGALGGGGAGFFQVPDPVPRVAQFGGGLGGSGSGGAEGFVPGGGGLGQGLSPKLHSSNEQSLQFTRDDLIEAIQLSILPESWSQHGGEAECTPLGGLLLIRQTEEAHKQIEKLLADIRTEGGNLHTVTVDAVWVSLTSKELEALTASQEKDQGGELNSVDSKQLKQLAKENPSHQGQIRCYNNQTVHLVSGNRRSVVFGAVPTVGFGSVGYHPQVACPNIGLLLQVRPTVDPNRKTAVLNVMSTKTEWLEPGEGVVLKTEFEKTEKNGLTAPGGTTSMNLDRVNLKTQHLGTTVRMPLGKPVLIGGLSTLDSEKKPKSDEPDRQLYLFVKLTVNESGE